MENPRYRGGSIPSKIFKVLDNSGKIFILYTLVVVYYIYNAYLFHKYARLFV